MTHLRKTLLLLICLPLAAFSLGKDTEIDVGAYFWAPNFSGSIVVNGVSFPIDTSLTKLIQKSNTVGLLTGHFEARHKRWGGFIDFVYADLIFANQTIATGGDIDVEYKLFNLEWIGYYRAIHRNWQPCRCYWIDILVGGRYADYEFVFDVAGRRGERIADGVSSWIDPLIGLRSVVELFPCLDLFFRGDVGGFGIGSHMSWQLFGGFHYNFRLLRLKWTAVLLYRALDQNYSDGSGTNQFNVVTYGPLAGIGLRF